MQKTNTATCLSILSVMVLNACCTMTGPAPESVAGRIIRLDDTDTQIQECPIGTSEWSAWKKFKYGCVSDFQFNAANQHLSSHTPSETSSITYKKTGSATAEIYYESAEQAHTCYLKFNTPTSGTATKEGYGAEHDYKQRNIQFSIK